MTTTDAEPANASVISDDAWLQDEGTRRDTLYMCMQYRPVSLILSLIWRQISLCK